MSPRLTDWSLALAVGVAFATGVVSLVSGRAEQWLIFAVHGAAGLWLALLSVPKLRRVWPRLLLPHAWDKRTLLGTASTLFVALCAASGVWWTLGGELFVAGFNLLNWHIVLGLTLTLFVTLHMFARARPLAARHLRDRRQVLGAGTLLLSAAALWPVQHVLGETLLPRSRRRFTGSREVGSYAGNAFPATSWVADNPRALDVTTWRLQVGGAVQQPLALTLTALLREGDALEATLDCTGGFYTAQHWRGARVGRLLRAAGVRPEARYVRFVSITGYRWSLPIAEAETALLATHVGDAPLAHGHGAPLRLVAPGQRGFAWVKWVVRVEALTEPDVGQVLSLYTSSLTPAGRGEGVKGMSG